MYRLRSWGCVLPLWSPPPPEGDVAYDGLTAIIHLNMLDGDGLFSAQPIPFQSLHLGRKGPRELVEDTAG